MKSEIYGEDLDEDDDAVVSNWLCANCGASVEVWNLSPNEQKEREKQNNGTN